jgi:hypothetical protein
MINRKIELLAPAGDLERLKINLLYGADAVYFGGKKYSLRANASNFGIEEIKEACDKLKKYIDINNLYIIGSIANKEKNSPWWFDYQNSNFKEVFGERYIEIEGSNADNMKNCTKKLIKKLKM